MPQQRILATMITTTSYGTWLPGDCRGYVERGRMLPASPELEAQARSRMTQPPVTFSNHEQDRLFTALCDASGEYGYTLVAASVEAWHCHWLVDHGFDPIPRMVGRLKNRMRQALDRGRIWTRGYDHRMCRCMEHVDARCDYINQHRGARDIEPM